MRGLIFPTRVSPRGVAFVARFEGFVGHAYNDAVGNATVGYGHLLHMGRVTPEDTRRWAGLSRASGLALLELDLRSAERSVLAGVRPALLAQHRFDAIVSAVFNLGPGVLSPRHTLGFALNQWPRRHVGDALLLYDHAGGQVLPGLTRRRRAERALWEHGDYDA